MLNSYLNSRFSALVCRLVLKKAIGLENLPKKKGYIVAANHTSYLDIPVMYAAFFNKAGRYIRFIARNSLLEDVYFRACTFLFENELNRVIRLDSEKPEEAFSEAVAALKKGDVVGIYPEGTRSPTGKLQKGKTGVIRLALSSKSPIVPIGITGTYELMPIGKPIPKIKKIVTMNIGKPIYFNKYYNKNMTKKSLRKLTDQVMVKISKLANQKYKQ